MPEHRPSDPVATAVAVFRLSIVVLVGAGFAYLLAGSFGGGVQAGPWVIGYHLKGTPVSVHLGSSCETKAGIRSSEGAATCQRVRWTVDGHPRTGRLIANTTDIQGAGTRRLSFSGEARADGAVVYGKPGPATTTAVFATAVLLTLSTLGFLTSALLRLRRPARTQAARTPRPVHPIGRPTSPQPASPTPASQHGWSEPPAWSQPVHQHVHQPAWSDPVHQPAWSEPVEQRAWSQPLSQPAWSDPVHQPAWSEPVQEPAPAQPAPAQPAPAQPAPGVPDPAEPAPERPAPDEPTESVPAGTTWQQQPTWSPPTWSQPAAQPVAHP